MKLKCYYELVKRGAVCEVQTEVVQSSTQSHAAFRWTVASDGFYLWIARTVEEEIEDLEEGSHLCFMDCLLDGVQVNEQQRFYEDRLVVSVVPLPTSTVPRVLELRFPVIEGEHINCVHKITLDPQLICSALLPPLSYHPKRSFMFDGESAYVSAIYQTEVGLYLDAGLQGALKSLDDKGWLAVAYFHGEDGVLEPLIPIGIRDRIMFACANQAHLSLSDIVTRVHFEKARLDFGCHHTHFQAPEEE